MPQNRGNEIGGGEGIVPNDVKRLDQHVADLRTDPELRAWVQEIQEAAGRVRSGISTPEAEGWGKPFESPADLDEYIESEKRRFFGQG